MGRSSISHFFFFFFYVFKILKGVLKRVLLKNLWCIINLVYSAPSAYQCLALFPTWYVVWVVDIIKTMFFCCHEGSSSVDTSRGSKRSSTNQSSRPPRFCFLRTAALPRRFLLYCTAFHFSLWNAQIQHATCSQGFKTTKLLSGLTRPAKLCRQTLKESETLLKAQQTPLRNMMLRETKGLVHDCVFMFACFKVF